MLRCQFLCHVLKALFCIKIAPKLSYFCKKMQTFGTLGAPPPDPRASGGWGRSPQTPSLRQLGASSPDPRRLGAPPPDPQESPPLRIFRYAPGCAFERRSTLEFGGKSTPVLMKTFFWSSPEIEKSVPFLAKTFFFWSSLNLFN